MVCSKLVMKQQMFSEQLNVSIRYVDDDYTIKEDPIGMFSLTDTYAETICSVIKDILLVLYLFLFAAGKRMTERLS